MMMMINGEDLADVIRLENYHRHFLYKPRKGSRKGPTYSQIPSQQLYT